MKYLTMIFLHIVDDYYLQGILANMKQRDWWRQSDQYKDMYAYDYIVALVMHSFSWAFMVMLPIAIAMRFNVSINFIVILFVNALIHGIVDHLKANKKCINLVTDQLIHIAQILLTGLYF